MPERSRPWRQVRAPESLDGDEAARGRFRVSVRSRRWLRVVVEGDAIAPVTSTPFRVDETFSCGPLVLRARPGVSLLCRAVDARGDAVAGAELADREGDVCALTWHFIGRIQSNKTATLAARFHWVHTVDRLKIARRLRGAVRW